MDGIITLLTFVLNPVNWLRIISSVGSTVASIVNVIFNHIPSIFAKIQDISNFFVNLSTGEVSRNAVFDFFHDLFTSASGTSVDWWERIRQWFQNLLTV